MPVGDDALAARLKTVRYELLQLVRRKSARSVVWQAEEPIDWRPTECIDPRSGDYFTEAGAWSFIAELLEGELELEEIVLEKPPGKKGYVLHVQLEGAEVYIKLRLGSGQVIGRSFHESKGGGR